MLFLSSVCHLKVPCRHPYLQRNSLCCTSRWYQRDEHHLIFWPLGRILIVSCKSLPQICEKTRLVNQLAWLYVQTHFVFWLTFPLPDAKSCIFEASATWGQNGAPADVMLEELGSPSERLQRVTATVCAVWSPLWKVREISPKKCRKLNSGSRFRNYSKLLQMFAMAEVE